jgi:hypothetical protein
VVHQGTREAPVESIPEVPFTRILTNHRQSSGFGEFLATGTKSLVTREHSVDDRVRNGSSGIRVEVHDKVWFSGQNILPDTECVLFHGAPSGVAREGPIRVLPVLGQISHSSLQPSRVEGRVKVHTPALEARRKGIVEPPDRLEAYALVSMEIGGHHGHRSPNSRADR